VIAYRPTAALERSVAAAVINISRAGGGACTDAGHQTKE